MADASEASNCSKRLLTSPASRTVDHSNSQCIVIFSKIASISLNIDYILPGICSITVSTSTASSVSEALADLVMGEATTGTFSIFISSLIFNTCSQAKLCWWPSSVVPIEEDVVASLRSSSPIMYEAKSKSPEPLAAAAE